MRTTIELPDDLYKNVKLLAVERNSSVRQLVMDALALLLRQPIANPPQKHFLPPMIRSTRTDKLVIDNETIYDLIDFP